MTLHLELTPEEEVLLRLKAQACGLSEPEYLRSLIAQSADSPNIPSALPALLQSWIQDGNVREHSETYDALREGINANHSSSRVVLP